MGLIQRFFGAIFGFIGGIFGAIFGIFRRRPKTDEPQPQRQDKTFFLDPEDAKSVGRQNEPAAPTPKPEPVAAKPTTTPTLVFSSGSPDLTNRRRPGPNMNSFLDMAKQIRRA